MKSYLRFRIICGTLFLWGSMVFFAAAQTPSDGIMMYENQACVGLDYGQDAWHQYWEGTLLRENGNLGTVNRRTIALSVNYGLSNRLNVIARLPYVRVEASNGQLAPSHGFQDWGVWLKGKITQFGHWSFIGVLGASGPASSYAVDYMPLNLGLGAYEGTLRSRIQYKNNQGFYGWAQAGVHIRSNIRIERNYYYTDRAYYTNLVDMPNAYSWGASVGRWWKGDIFRVELNANGVRTLGGHDIRRNDSPFPSNRMNVAQLGGLVQYFPPAVPKLGVLAGISQTLMGRNTGQSTVLNTGIQYRFWINSSPSTSGNHEIH